MFCQLISFLIICFIIESKASNDSVDYHVTDHSTAMRSLSNDQIMYLKYFVGNISIYDCYDDDPIFKPDYWLNKMTIEERKKWNQPIQGVWRSQINITYPCDKSAWISGKWQAVPMWSHCCNKGFGIARCPERVIEVPTIRSTLVVICSDDTTLLCPTFLPMENSNNNETILKCLVYTFGIANL
jgi:hypothetical protein